MPDPELLVVRDLHFKKTKKPQVLNQVWVHFSGITEKWGTDPPNSGLNKATFCCKKWLFRNGNCWRTHFYRIANSWFFCVHFLYIYLKKKKRRCFGWVGWLVWGFFSLSRSVNSKNTPKNHESWQHWFCQLRTGAYFITWNISKWRDFCFGELKYFHSATGYYPVMLKQSQ